MFSPVAFLMRCDVVQRIPHIETWQNVTKYCFVTNFTNFAKVGLQMDKVPILTIAFILFMAIAVGLILIQVKLNLFLALNSLYNHNYRGAYHIVSLVVHSLAVTWCLGLCAATYIESDNMTAHGQEWLKELSGVALLHSMNWCHVLAGKQVAGNQCGCMFA